MRFIMGTDIGGTFTDTVVMNQAGETFIFKVPSTPRDLSKGVIASIELASQTMGLSVNKLLAKTDTFFHGTTQAINTLLTKQGSKVGLITTRGFRDTVPMMRASRTTSTDALKMDMPSFRDETALIPIYLIEEVTERIDSKGDEVLPLDMDDAARAVRNLVDQGVEAIAICFLWSIANPDHEQQVKQYINENYPELFVSISSETMPVIREYERSVTTLVNSYVAKSVQRYLTMLQNNLNGAGLGGSFLVVQSTGAALSLDEAMDKPFQLIMSGPAGGVVGSLFLGEALGHNNIITLDMGGTSADVGLIVDGQTTMFSRSKLAGYDIAMPRLDVTSIGAGGGSIAWIDHGVLLRVGPKSAGAEPGPACYNRGGIEPTVTDANVVLGYIDPAYFLDGRMEIRPELSEQVITRLGEKMGLGMIETAMGIIEVVNSNMVNAVRGMTVERGYDPRDFAMWCFGGAGGLHAGALIEELGIQTAIIPYTATAQSPYGFVCSDICHHLVKSHYITHPADPAPFNEVFSQLEQEGRELLTREGNTGSDTIFKRYVDLRFCGQIFEITIDVPFKTLNESDVADIMTAFEEAYEKSYGKGTGWKEAGIELINFRLDAIRKMPKPALRKFPLVGGDPKVAQKGTRSCCFSKARGFAATPVYDGDALLSGMTIRGPAIVAMHSTSVIVGLEQDAYVNEYRGIVISIRRKE